jgi:hypothetical protein
MMTAAYIVSRVRRKLGEVDISNIPDLEIYELAQEVQNNILNAVRPEINFSILLVPGQEAYLFPDETTVQISSVLPSWQYGHIEFVPQADWKQYRDMASGSVGNPFHATIFARTMYLSPVPQSCSVPPAASIEFWAHQVASDVPILASGSILPRVLDTTLILGICAEYEPENFKLLYEKSLSDNSYTVDMRSALLVSKINW